MREILFRAKAINRDPNREYRTNYKNGDWVYGLITEPYNDKYDLPMEMKNTHGVSGIEVDYKTLGQYTGLTDMNGNKIFEDDIIQSYHHREPMGVAVIYWQGSSFWCDLLSGSQFDGCNTLGEWDCECGIEIIGNIFDNKDMVDAREWSSDGEWLGE